MMNAGELSRAITQAAEQLGRIISAGLVNTDRQRINISSTTILYHGVLTSTEWVLLYTAAENTRTEILEWIIANNEDLENVVSFTITPKNVNPSDDHLVFPQVEVSSKDFELLKTNTSLISEWSLHARATSANRIVLHISGTEIVN